MTDIDLRQMIDDLPPGIERAILRALSFRVGRDKAIRRGDLLRLVSQQVGTVHDRQLRLAINELRKQGNMICSTGGIGGGYYMPANWDELNEYLEREVHSRAMDLLEQEQALKAEAEKRWGKFSMQGTLF